LVDKGEDRQQTTNKLSCTDREE